MRCVHRNYASPEGLGLRNNCMLIQWPSLLHFSAGLLARSSVMKPAFMYENGRFSLAEYVFELAQQLML